MRKQTVLEGYLSFWEDTMFVLNILQKFDGLPPVPAFENAARFRHVLLGSYRQLETDLDSFYSHSQRNIENLGDDSDLLEYCRQCSSTPFEILDWTRSSRRVFKLGAEMQHAFEHISAADVARDDIVWPFDAFLLELSAAISVVTPTGQRYTGSNILVSQPFRYVADFRDTSLGHLPVTAITLLNDGFVQYKPLNAEEKRVALSSMMSPHPTKALKFIINKAGRILKSGERLCKEMLLVPTFGPESVQDYFNDQGITDPVGQKMLRLVMNLCLYLEAIENTQDVVRHGLPHKPTRGQPINVITDGTRVCEVANVHSLQSLAATNRPGAGHKITEPHWRRRHNRRPPGSGADPSAEKTVRVKPTLVRPDLIPMFGLPGGSVTKI